MIEQPNWSNRKNTVDDYISPEYYNSIIKDYVFNDLTDLEIFQQYIAGKTFESVLELGSGSGRVTDITLNSLNFNQLTLTDLSEQMIEFQKKKYRNRKISYVQSDHMDYLKTTLQKFDFVYCIWSLSHSINAHLYKAGKNFNSTDIFNNIKDFVKHRIKNDGEMFILHFDSTSQEQTILLSQWKRVYRLYTDITEQSPSKKILDKVFEDLARDNVIEFSSEHYIGRGITYCDDEEYLELFMNFHLETFFNKTNLFDVVKDDILSLGKKYKADDGSYTIKPGCFIYKVKKL